MRDVSVARLPRQGSMLLMRLMAASVFIVAAASVAFSAHAQGHPGHRGSSGDGRGGDAMMLFAGPPEHIARSVDRMLDGLNATPAQRTQVKEIATAAAADLRAQHEAGRALREQGVQIFTAPTVDTAAAESLRQQSLAQHDQASKRALQAMLDVAKVLTPEQRAKLGSRMKDRRAVMTDRAQRMQHERPMPRPRAASQPAPPK